MNYSKSIRILRAAKGISQQDLAINSGISKSLISKIESGLRGLSNLNKLKIAKSLGIPESLIEILAFDAEKTKIAKSDLETIGRLLIKIGNEIQSENNEVS